MSGRWPLILSILGCNWFWCRRKYKPLVSQGVKSGQMREEKKHAEVGKRVRNTRKDQSMAGVINFILTGVHAACMHCMQSACSLHAELSKLSSSLDWFWWGFLMHHNLPSSSGWFCNHLFDSSACILHALHADLSRLWVLLEIQKSKWYVPSRPLPYAGFFMKRRKYIEMSNVEIFGPMSIIFKSQCQHPMSMDEIC